MRSSSDLLIYQQPDTVTVIDTVSGYQKYKPEKHQAFIPFAITREEYLTSYITVVCRDNVFSKLPDDLAIEESNNLFLVMTRQDFKNSKQKKPFEFFHYDYLRTLPQGGEPLSIKAIPLLIIPEKEIDKEVSSTLPHTTLETSTKKRKMKGKGKEKCSVAQSKKTKTKKIPEYFSLQNIKDIKRLEKLTNISYTVGELDLSSHLSIGKVAVISSDNQAGYGVFAVMPMVKGQILAEYVGERTFPNEQSEDREYYYLPVERNGKLHLDKRGFDARNKRNVAAFVNHSDAHANVIFFYDPMLDKIVMEAISNIQPGEQVLGSYGCYYDFSQSLFLHPSDNADESETIYRKNKKHYSSKLCHFDNIDILLDSHLEDLTVLGIKLTDVAWIPRGVHAMLNNNHNIQNIEEIDLPILIVSAENKKFLRRNEREKVTTLMMAAYLGRVDIVERLIKSSDPCQQQYFSGKTALHFALLGCMSTFSNQIHLEKLTPNRIKIIELLANGISIKDSADISPFLLSIQCDSVLLLRLLLQNCKIPILKVLSTSEKNDRDPFVYALVQGKMEYAIEILKAFKKRSIYPYLNQLANVIFPIFLTLEELENIAKTIKIYINKKEASPTFFTSVVKRAMPDATMVAFRQLLNPVEILIKEKNESILTEVSKSTL